jgi:A/G-specific adenine glycosylase
VLNGNELIQFRRDLLEWFERAKRDLPWRRRRDAYAIWVSEAMLQQTRVAAVLPYYERFLKLYPDIEALAEAREEELLAAWAGLGYYYRARNLQKAARQMCSNGGFPSCYAELRSLPGVGDYTAAAVASMAFGLPHAVVDGNVLRVLARLFADPMDVAGSGARKHFAKLAEALLDSEQPGAFNQAMMELGATICLTRKPQCLLCPAADYCRAAKTGNPEKFPVKSPKHVSVREERVLFWIEKEGRVLAWRRPAESRLMPGFWELPERAQVGQMEPGRSFGTFRHSITVHHYSFDVREAPAPEKNNGCEWLSLAGIQSLPISTVFRKAIELVRASGQRNGSAYRAAKG